MKLVVDCQNQIEGSWEDDMTATDVGHFSGCH